MLIYTAPERYFLRDIQGHFSVFLAGSIEMGAAEDWQQRVIARAGAWENHEKLVILNPRRRDWDSSWIQSVKNPQFVEQVLWELRGLCDVRLIMMNLAPGTKSPISLLELGLYARQYSKMIVLCPEGFWRKGNVDVLAGWLGGSFQVFESEEEWLRCAEKRFAAWCRR